MIKKVGPRLKSLTTKQQTVLVGKRSKNMKLVEE